MIRDVALVLGAYLLGSVPFGLLIARLRGGVDLRRVGSGNIGATNVLRAMGKGAAALTLVGDIGKGALAVGIGRTLEVSPALLAIIALSAVIGHLLPVFLGFRGGKGVATTLGVVLAAMPAVGVLLLVIWIAVAIIWRYSSLAALVAAAALPVLAWGLDGRPVMVVLAGVLFLLILLRHRENIARLCQGTEGKIGQKVASPESPEVT
ncbi:MAG TPA: glycerol-3-phosphate 1-O-acyltransferase PlsY [Candidatus Methylomirabilis sp.]|nr:glycerol-3-phosphate 1-O-acyltransferase PlsY [Candidatus Methylomirabilis sp.]